MNIRLWLGSGCVRVLLRSPAKFHMCFVGHTVVFTHAESLLVLERWQGRCTYGCKCLMNRRGRGRLVVLKSSRQGLALKGWVLVVLRGSRGLVRDISGNVRSDAQLPPPGVLRRHLRDGTCMGTKRHSLPTYPCLHQLLGYRHRPVEQWPAGASSPGAGLPACWDLLGQGCPSLRHQALHHMHALHVPHACTPRACRLCTMESYLYGTCVLHVSTDRPNTALTCCTLLTTQIECCVCWTRRTSRHACSELG
jgi:hypothetical protein